MIESSGEVRFVMSVENNGATTAQSPALDPGSRRGSLSSVPGWFLAVGGVGIAGLLAVLVFGVPSWFRDGTGSGHGPGSGHSSESQAVEGDYRFVDGLCDEIDWSLLSDGGLDDIEVDYYNRPHVATQMSCDHRDDGKAPTTGIIQELSVSTEIHSSSAKAEKSYGDVTSDGEVDKPIADAQSRTPWDGGYTVGYRDYTVVTVAGSYWVDNMVTVVFVDIVCQDDDDAKQLAKDNVEYVEDLADNIRELTHK